SSFSKAYRFPDEALKHSVQNAHMMLNDPAIFEPMNSRILLTSQLNWHITPEDEEDPRQKYVAEMLGMLLRKIKHFPKYLETLMWATWYGRYAIQNQFGTMKKDGRNWYYVKGW